MDYSVEINLKDSFHKFENLLAKNVLFVDYFNEFLSTPSLGERLKFNHVTGDLELIEDLNKDQTDKKEESEEFLISKHKNGKKSKKESQLGSTAEGVKKKLDIQLKSIIKKNGRTKIEPLNDGTARDRDQTASTLKNKQKERELKKKELLDQINKHSFRDIDLIKIEAILEPSELKDPKATAEAKQPNINTKYNVNALRKPFSMKWLRNRRLTLFLQSDFYNEFKLATIISQFGLFNNDLTKNLLNQSQNVDYIQVELDDELLSIQLNPFKVPNELEKFIQFEDLDQSPHKNDGPKQQENVEKLEIKDKPESEKKKEEKKEEKKNVQIEDVNEKTSNEKIENKRILISSDQELYYSIGERMKTSLLINKTTNQDVQASYQNDFDNDNNDKNSNENQTEAQDQDYLSSQETPIIIGSVKEMANLLVNSAMKLAILDLGDSDTDTSRVEAKLVEKNYRYCFSGKQRGEKALDLNDFVRCKSSSRMSYYKDFQTENDMDEKEDEDENEEDGYYLEFEDEPHELTQPYPINEASFRKIEMENFKEFLKENDAIIFYDLWNDIEKLRTIFNQKDKLSHIKQLKTRYNHPQILKILQKEHNSNGLNDLKNKRNKYYELYAQYEKNVDLWSYEYLTTTTQKNILSLLVKYWWPKYCIKLNSFQNYAQQKYPFYIEQKNLVGMQIKRPILNDLDAENVEKSLHLNYKPRPRLTEQNLEDVKVKKQKPIESRHTDILKKVTLDAKALDAAKKKPRRIYLEGYEHGPYKTTPPVGWKRPVSRATLIAQNMIENPTQTDAILSKEEKKAKHSKEIYLEAIYREDLAGQIFMKYLISVNKLFAINRLKCLQELNKYKDLFYSENFNKETALKSALDIFSKYVAVSASNTIDCPKSERLKLHYLLNEHNSLINIEASTTKALFKPVYEDTFDSIEEFLLSCLYEDWKLFIETEYGFYCHNEIEKIERTINIRSKKINDLVEQGLVKLVPKSTNPSAMDYSINTSLSELNSSYALLANNWDSQSTISLNRMLDLNEIMNNTRDFEMFKKFLESNNALNDLLCLLDIEAYSQIDSNRKTEIEEHARMLRKKYLNKKYLFSKNGPLDEETQNIILEKIGGWKVMLEDLPPSLLIILAKKYIERKLINHWIPMYQGSDLKDKSDLRSRTQMNDVVDDVISLKNKQMFNKDISNARKQRWLFSSQTIINFGKALRNSFTIKVFSKFLALKTNPSHLKGVELDISNNLTNSLQFLIEVQDYKDLCQKSPDDTRSIVFKMNHIIDCFINNRVPPRIRIDLPENVFKKILEQKDFISPYLFLDAYFIAFNNLMPYWIEFNKIRSHKDLDLFDEFNSFKKLKDIRPKSSKRISSASSIDSTQNPDDRSSHKWSYNQYIKALKTQLVT